MVSIFKFKFPWATHVTPDDYTKLCQLVGSEIRAEKREVTEKTHSPEKTITLQSWDEYQCDVVNLMENFPEIKPELVSVVDVVRVENSLLQTVSLINSLVAKVEKLHKASESIMDQSQLFNMKCNVHVPGLGLLTMDEVTYEDDCCTEHLQDRINEGWRILAVCPQPDQRRPDYILGRNSMRGREY